VEIEPGMTLDWPHEHVLEILREADPSAWRAEKAEALRQRVRSVVETLKRRSTEIANGGAVPGAFLDRIRSLGATMERALPTDATRARWAAFVGAVHPEYEALLASFPPEASGASGSSANGKHHRPTNYARSFMHFVAALVGCTAVEFLPRKGLLAVSLSFFTYAWSMEAARRVSPAINARLMRFYRGVIHPHEHFRVNSATWFATSLLLLASLASRKGMMAALCVLGVADPFAALIGRRWGRHKIRTGRSLEGTIAFVISGTLTAALGLALLGEAVGNGPSVMTLALWAALTGAVAELVTSKLDDNLTIPVAVGAVVTLATL
jgi:dolichol kinase